MWKRAARGCRFLISLMYIIRFTGEYMNKAIPASAYVVTRQIEVDRLVGFDDLTIHRSAIFFFYIEVVCFRDKMCYLSCDVLNSNLTIKTTDWLLFPRYLRFYILSLCM